MIPIQNIYYMLSYAFHILREKGYKSIETESFDNTAELCAAILARGVATQIKRGLGKTYLPQTEALSTPRGKIDITDSIKARSIEKKQLVCTYDDFTVNSKMNRIIKSTMLLLVASDINKKWKKELKKLLLYFGDVDEIDLYSIDWHFQFNRNNQTYQMLISICYLVIKGLIQTNSDGNTRVMDFFDEQRMCRLYEKFILEYYRKEWPSISATAAQIPWQLDDDNDFMLPVMQTDITLTHGSKTLIIDAKYYAHTLQSQFDSNSIISGNLYQIFTYVKNKDAQFAGQDHEVAGLLLYAKTDEEIALDNEYKMSGNCISVKTLDLGTEFKDISKQLDNIAGSFFGEKR